MTADEERTLWPLPPRPPAPIALVLAWRGAWSIVVGIAAVLLHSKQNEFLDCGPPSGELYQSCVLIQPPIGMEDILFGLEVAVATFGVLIVAIGLLRLRASFRRPDER